MANKVSSHIIKTSLILCPEFSDIHYTEEVMVALKTKDDLYNKSVILNWICQMTPVSVLQSYTGVHSNLLMKVSFCFSRGAASGQTSHDPPANNSRDPLRNPDPHPPFEQHCSRLESRNSTSASHGHHHPLWMFLFFQEIFRGLSTGFLRILRWDPKAEFSCLFSPLRPKVSHGGQRSGKGAAEEDEERGGIFQPLIVQIIFVILLHLYPAFLPL